MIEQREKEINFNELMNAVIGFFLIRHVNFAIFASSVIFTNQTFHIFEMQHSYMVEVA